MLAIYKLEGAIQRDTAVDMCDAFQHRHKIDPIKKELFTCTDSYILDKLDINGIMIPLKSLFRKKIVISGHFLVYKSSEINLPMDFIAILMDLYLHQEFIEIATVIIAAEKYT